MVELNVAASVLLDPARRAAYDAAHAAETERIPRAEPFYPWSSGVHASSGGVRTDADAREDWVSERARTASAPDDVAADLSDVRGLRGAPARTLERVLRFMDGRTPGGHVSLTLASIALAFLLIASARPRSLFPPPEADQTIAACDLGSR
jgi:hypothetical protein